MIALAACQSNQAPEVHTLTVAVDLPEGVAGCFGPPVSYRRVWIARKGNEFLIRHHYHDASPEVFVGTGDGSPIKPPAPYEGFEPVGGLTELTAALADIAASERTAATEVHTAVFMGEEKLSAEDFATAMHAIQTQLVGWPVILSSAFEDP